MKNKLIVILAFCFLVSPFTTHANVEQYPDLEYGVTHPFVSQLQKFLNNNGYIVNTLAGEPGSLGYEGNYFGELTQKALSFFQKDNSIEPSIGYFGPKTKAKIDLLKLTFNDPENIFSSSETEYSNVPPTEGDSQSKSYRSLAGSASSSKAIGKIPDPKNSTTFAYGDYFDSAWAVFIDGKFIRYNEMGTFRSGEMIEYWLSDFDIMTKIGFFKGWSGGCNWATGGLGRNCVFPLYAHTEIRTDYYNCAELPPKHVFFDSITALEKKLVQFANNKSDKKLGIKATGEVGALAVVYSDGGVCAKIYEGCNGGVDCPLDSRADFLTAYKGKSITDILFYHTHDKKTVDLAIYKQRFIYTLYDVKNKMYTMPLPSDGDLAGEYVLKRDKVDYKILKLYATEKVISPNGTGYIYSVPLSTKDFNSVENSKKFKKDLDKGAVKKWENPGQDQISIHGRAKIVFDWQLDFYKKRGITIIPFTVK